MKGLVKAWGRVLAGYTPALSIEITRECPLHCPGCYAYGEDHLNGGPTLRQLNDLKGDDLIRGILALVDRHRPLHVSIVGGEPLVRYRELGEILPALSQRGLYVQLVTSAVREIPRAWHGIPDLSIVVSIDGLQPEHDARRTPATYDRILKHIAGHDITVHCTVTRPQMARPGYLDEFLAFWSARSEVERIWMSLYTPQIGEASAERLTPADRRQAVQDLQALRRRYAKLFVNDETLAAYAAPPQSPAECVFARMTTSVSADLTTRITPCQFGGAPDCRDCGCLASAGLAAIGRHRVLGLVSVESLINRSLEIGALTRRVRGTALEA